MSCLSTGGSPPPPATPPIPTTLRTPPKPTSGGNNGKAIFNEVKQLSSWQHQLLSLSCHLCIFLTGLDIYKLLTRLILKLLVNTSRSSHLLITLIILDSASSIRELKQPRRRRQQKLTNLHIWQWKTVFLHALHVHFSSFDILKTFSSFLRREMTCFAVAWTTWAYADKCSILSSSFPSAGSNLIAGYLEHIFQL